MRLLIIFLFTSVAVFAQYDTLTHTYSDGTVKASLPRYQKRVEGIARFFYPDGKIREERRYSAGKVDGLVKQYDSLGRMRVTFTVENGKREGPCTYFAPDGTFERETFYVNGIIELPDTSSIPEDESPVLTEAAAPPAVVEDTNRIVKEIPKIVEQPKQIDTLAVLLARDTLFVDMTIPGNPLLARLSVAPAPRIGWKALQEKIVFPEIARKKGISGTIRVKALINTSGDVVRDEAVNTLGYGCEDAALISVFYTRFYAAEINGVKKPVELLFDIEFLQNSK